MTSKLQRATLTADNSIFHVEAAVAEHQDASGGTTLTDWSGHDSWGLKQHSWTVVIPHTVAPRDASSETSILLQCLLKENI